MTHSNPASLMIGTILLAIGLSVSFLGYQELKSTHSLLETGERTQARVVTVNYLSPSQQGKTASYIPVVAWKSKDGKNIEVVAGFSSPDSSSYRIGDTFTVTYDLNKPETRYYITRQGSIPKPRFTDYITMIIGAVFGIFGMLFIRKWRTSHY